MSPRIRAAAAGAFAATVWGLQERFDRRLFGCNFSDVELLGRGRRSVGYVIHTANGAVFGLAFDAVRQRIDVEQQRLALALALGEHLALWPLMGVVDRALLTSPRAFALETWRHALFGAVLGRLA